MALSCVDDDSANSLRQEVAQRLWDTQLPGGQWGNYWESEHEHDQTPQVLTTAAVIISFLIFAKDDDGTRQGLQDAAQWLESKVVSGIDLDPLPRIAAITALVAIWGERLSKDARAAANRLARAPAPEPGDLGVYFCDFRYYSEDLLQCGRDYFIVPKATLLALGGFLPKAPAFLRLRSERILDGLVYQLKKGGFLYKPEPDRPAASKDNAWLALLLALAGQSRQALGLQTRLVYGLFRERGPGVFVDRVFPVMSMLMITGLGVSLQDVDSLFVRACSSLGTLIVGWICVPQVVDFFRRSR